VKFLADQGVWKAHQFNTFNPGQGYKPIDIRSPREQ